MGTRNYDLRLIESDITGVDTALSAMSVACIAGPGYFHRNPYYPKPEIEVNSDTLRSAEENASELGRLSIAAKVRLNTIPTKPRGTQ